MDDFKQCMGGVVRQARLSPSTHGSVLLRCQNRRKFGEYCGVHSPIEKARREKERGPNLTERQFAALNQSRREAFAAKEVIETARRALKYINDGGCSYNLTFALRQYDKTCKKGE